MALWIILAVILAARIAAEPIALVPRLPRLASGKVRPHLVSIWANIKAIAAEPRKIVYILAGSAISQLLIALPSARRCTRSGSTPASRR